MVLLKKPRPHQFSSNPTPMLYVWVPLVHNLTLNDNSVHVPLQKRLKIAK